MVSLLNDVCASLLNKFRMRQHTSMRKIFPRNKWFDDDCKGARREVRIAGRDVHKSLHHRTHFLIAKKRYKSRKNEVISK